MYTQCPRCETIFRLSAEVLRAAAGQVRCGRCGEAFNAISRLAESADGFTVGESPLDLENRADRILESATDLPDIAPRGGGIEDGDEPDERERFEGPEMAALRFERLEVLEEPQAEEDGSLEFTLPPGELDRIFIAPPGPQVGTAADPPIDVEFESPAPPVPPAAPISLRPPRRRMATALGVVAALVLALALAAQIVHRNRGYIATHTPFGGALQSLYARLGVALPVPAHLSAYQLRQWGVTGDPTATGTLRVRASILNTAATFQPYPLLRVALTDRFGHRVGTRDFEPREYLGKPPAGLMAPGMRADVTIAIVDPGKDAEGFELDVCLRGSGSAVFCADDAKPRTQ